MAHELTENDLEILGPRLRSWLVLVWPLFLLATYMLLALFSFWNGTFRYMPCQLTGAAGGYGFLQDPFSTIYQFGWIPFLFAMLCAYRSVPRMVLHFVAQAGGQSEEVKTGVEIPPGLEDIVSMFRRQLTSRWQWYAAFLFAFLSVLLELSIQLSRISGAGAIYWWDWRVSRSAFVLSVAIVAVNASFVTLLVYRAVCSLVFMRRFLSFIKLSPRPLHPDGAGGLGVIGKTCVAFTFPLLVIGIMLASSFVFRGGALYLAANLFLLMVYVLCVIAVYYFPLLPVHDAMARNKNAWLEGISQEINEALTQLEVLLKDVSNDPDPLFKRLDNLNRYYGTVHSMPVWPYDIETLSRMSSSILLPVAVVAARYLF